MILNNHCSIRRVDYNMFNNLKENIIPYHTNGKFYFQYGGLHCQNKKGWLAMITKKKLNHTIFFNVHHKNCSYEFYYKVYLKEDAGIFSDSKSNLVSVSKLSEKTQYNFTLFDTSASSKLKKVSETECKKIGLKA